VVVEVGTKRVDGSPDPTVTPPAENHEGILRWGSQQAPGIALREAQLLLIDVISQGVKIEIGLTTWFFGGREDGSSLAFNPRRSQTIERNFDSISGQTNVEEPADARLIEAAYLDETEPIGAVISYRGGIWSLDLVILPAVIEEGTSLDDESLYALDFWIRFEGEITGRIGVIVAYSMFRGDNLGLVVTDTVQARLLTYGVAGVLTMFEGAIEIVIEGYGQTGKVAETPASASINAAGYAVSVGVTWRHLVGNPLPIRFGANYFRISGDGDTNPEDKQVNRFGAYESINDLMILEDHYLGFDWDSNYTGVKIFGGAAFSAFADKDLDVSFIVGITRAAAAVGTGASRSDELGNEIDVKFKLKIGRPLTLELAVAYLFGSQVLKNAMNQGGGGPNANASESTVLFLLGFDLKL
jgi:hypothetical protein